jgi:hypothetical protein
MGACLDRRGQSGLGVRGRHECKRVETGSPGEHAMVRESAARASRDREEGWSSRWAASGSARVRATGEGKGTPQGLTGGVGWPTGSRYPPG